MPDAHQLVMQDLANHASERACRALLDAVELCEKPEHVAFVSIAVASAVAAAAHGALNAASGERDEPLDGAMFLDEIAALIRRAKGGGQ